MMTRRKFSVAAILGSILGFFIGRSTPAEEMGRAWDDPQTVPTEYDHTGSAVAQAYKLHEDGSYRRVKRHTLKAGDVFIMIGVEGDRLWRVAKFEVSDKGHFFHETGKKRGTEAVYIKENPTAVLIDAEFHG